MRFVIGGLKLDLPTLQPIFRLSDLSQRINDYHDVLKNAVEIINTSNLPNKAERIKKVEEILTPYYNVGILPAEDDLIHLQLVKKAAKIAEQEGLVENFVREIEAEIVKKEQECREVWAKEGLNPQDRQAKMKIYKIMDDYMDKIKREVIGGGSSNWRESLDSLIKEANRRGIKDELLFINSCENSRKVYEIYNDLAARENRGLDQILAEAKENNTDTGRTFSGNRDSLARETNKNAPSKEDRF